MKHGATTTPVECKAALAMNRKHMRGLAGYLRLHGLRTVYLVSLAPYRTDALNDSKIVNLPAHLLVALGGYTASSVLNRVRKIGPRSSPPRDPWFLQATTVSRQLYDRLAVELPEQTGTRFGYGGESARRGTPDGLPTVGPDPRVRGGYLWGAGHASSGMQQMPATAQVLTDLTLQRPPRLPIHQLAIRRYFAT